MVSPLALEAVRRIDTLFGIERAISGETAERRQAMRQELSAPLVSDLEGWLREQRAKLARGNDLAKAMDYLLKRWPAFTRFLDDGRICLSNNAAERALRGIALGRKSWLFAGSDRGGQRAAAMYSLIVTALCRIRHRADYAARRTMPNGPVGNPSFARTCGPSSGDCFSLIRHSLASYKASRKVSRRSFGWKRVRLPRSYGLSFARAASLSARWAWR